MTASDSSRAAQAGTGLVVMLKAPVRSKRRLARQIGPLAQDAAALLFGCAAEDAAGWPGPVCFAPASEADARWLARRVEGASNVIVQPQGNLGVRINHIDAALRSRGLERQIYIGTDCPDLDLAYLTSAAERLHEHDAVLGPAHDGGVVLMASRRPWPNLADLPWSTGALMAALESLCRASGFTSAHLEPRADIDSLDDLAGIEGSLAHDARPARRALHDWLRRHRTRLGTPA